jgi:hypothetical protein
MDQNNIVQVINSIIILIGVPATIVGLVFIGRKLQVLDQLAITTEKIKYNLKVVSDFLSENANNFNSSSLQNYSPVQLTESGSAFVEELGFEAVFKKNRADFLAFIDEEEPHFKYDVENAAIKSIYFLKDKSYMSFLKVYLYNTPKRRMNDVAPTLGIYVRDQYLAAHPEITE